MSMQPRWMLALGFGTLLACNADPTANHTKAQVAEAASAAAAPAGAVAYSFSAAGSRVEFVGAKVTGKHDGSFGSFTGRIDLPGERVEQGSVRVDLEMGSITTDAEKLTGHLKSPDFFDVARFPRASFQSTSLRPAGGSYTVTGNLTLHGVTKSIAFPARIRLVGTSLEVDAEFGINRKDFGVVYPGMPDDLIKDEVLIRLRLRAQRAAAAE